MKTRTTDGTTTYEEGTRRAIVRPIRSGNRVWADLGPNPGDPMNQLGWTDPAAIPASNVRVEVELVFEAATAARMVTAHIPSAGGTTQTDAKAIAEAFLGAPIA